jgi:acetylornithine deacetylase/succinyl-diaminopimelate desuccinylase-like protein
MRALQALTFLAVASLAAAQPRIPAPAGQAPAGFDRAEAQQHTFDLLKQLIALDTQNPPGNEMRVARHLESVLKGLPGIETQVLDEGDGRANFLARLRGTNATKRPVLVMGHMDTVGADPSKWTSPAFTPTERDGYLYGRGTIDDKGSLAATVIAMKMLASARASLDRDIILIGTAAEESGGPQGVEAMVTKHFDMIKDAEFALNEGGRIRVKNGKVVSINVQVTEKISYAVTATAKGTSGHGSVPLADNAIAALSRALGRVHALQMPVRLNATTREYFKRLAAIEPDA